MINSKSVLIEFITILFLFTMAYTFSFADNLNDAEHYLAPFSVKKLEGEEFEIKKKEVLLTETSKTEGGIFRFDVSEKGNIAVIYDEGRYLSIYDKDMNHLHSFVANGVEGVLYSNDELLLFYKDETCGIYNAENELLAIYDLNSDTGGSNPYSKYESMIERNIKQVDGYNYYITNKLSKTPQKLGYHNQCRYLIREKNKEKTVLIDRKEGWYMPTYIILSLLLGTCVLVKKFNSGRKRKNNI